MKQKNNTFIELTPELEQELLDASAEGAKGNFLTQSQLDEKVRQWLKEKK